MKVLTVFGTRPEAIKLAPVIKMFEQNRERFTSVVCITAQHRFMLDQVLDIFHITPEYDLDIMSPDQSLQDVTCNVLNGVSRVVRKERPDLVLVQGDTTTAFASGLAAYYERTPVGHVEAGLRTSDKYAPFPEEINRRLLTHLADLHFAPTSWSRNNLLREGVEEESIFVTGNTVIDALFMTMEAINNEKSEQEIVKYFSDLDTGLAELLAAPLPKGREVSRLQDRRFLLVTGHRRESFGEGFRNMCTALREIAETHRDVHIVYPVHLNPHVRRPVYDLLGGMETIHLIPPVGYTHFLYLMARSFFILTDSGGVQEEAPSLGKPVLVMREKTERPEGIEAGCVRLAGTRAENIVAEAKRLLDDAEVYAQMSQAKNPYGDGTTAQQIAAILGDERVISLLRKT